MAALAGDGGTSSTTSAGGLIRRSFLVRRCYLNPQSFGDYRPYFVRNGFQVVDCPALTSRSKNGADIQIVMDVLDSLEHPTRFEELSCCPPTLTSPRCSCGCALMTARPPSWPWGCRPSAYRAACDILFTDEDFIEQGFEEQPEAEGEISTEPLPAGEPTLVIADGLKARALELIRSAIAGSPHPLTSGAVARVLRTALGEEIGESWGQVGAFVASSPGLVTWGCRWTGEAQATSTTRTAINSRLRWRKTTSSGRARPTRRSASTP